MRHKINAVPTLSSLSQERPGARESTTPCLSPTEAPLDALAASLRHRSTWLVDIARESSVPTDLARRGFELALELVESLLQLYDRGVVATGPEAEGYDARVHRGREGKVSAGTSIGDPVVKPCRVLIVEDHADAGELLRDLIDAQGHRAVVASTGEEALELMSEVRPDLVLCDLGLPGMTGLDVARTLRADPRWARIRLVALTGYGRPEDKAQCLAAGFDEHYTKPISLESLARVLGHSMP